MIGYVFMLMGASLVFWVTAWVVYLGKGDEVRAVLLTFMAIIFSVLGVLIMMYWMYVVGL